MAEEKRIRVFCEGDTDRVVIDAILAGAGLNRVAECVDPRKQGATGRDALIEVVASHLSVNPPLRAPVVIRDLDGDSPEKVAAWVVHEVGRHLGRGRATPAVQPTESEQVKKIVLNNDRTIMLVAVGLPEDPLLKAREISRFAMDDYLLVLAHDKDVYCRLSEFRSVSHEATFRKVDEMVALLRGNKIAVASSKRVLDLVRAITGCRASQARLAEMLLRAILDRGGTDALTRRLQPLTGDLETAIEAAGHP